MHTYIDLKEWAWTGGGATFEVPMKGASGSGRALESLQEQEPSSVGSYDLIPSNVLYPKSRCVKLRSVFRAWIPYCESRV